MNRFTSSYGKIILLVILKISSGVMVKRLRKKLNVVEDGAGNCIVSVRDIGYKFELNNENEQQ